MSEYLNNMARADRAYHDVAQLHLHEFESENNELV